MSRARPELKQAPKVSRDHSVDKVRGQQVGPRLDRLPRNAHAPSGVLDAAAEKRDRGVFVHEGAHLTPDRASSQIGLQATTKQGAKTGLSTSQGVPGRPRASHSTLIQRIDKALGVSGRTGVQLAEAIGIKNQNFTNMRNGRTKSMEPEHIARAAVFLACDLHWLITGEGGDYVEAGHGAQLATLSRLAREIARWVDELEGDDHLKAWAVMAQIRQGYWPTFRDDDDSASAPSDRPPHARGTS